MVCLALVRDARQLWQTVAHVVIAVVNLVLSSVDILDVSRILQVRARPDVSLVILRDEPLLYNK